MMTAFRVILLMTLVVSGIGTIADEKKKGSLLCLFALAGTLRSRAADPPPALKVFRLLAAEFAAVPDETLVSWLELTAPLVSKKRFGKLYDQALALLTAHRMKLSGAFDAASEEGGSSIGSLADTLRVASYTEGSTSISFNNGVSLAANDAELTLTGYGTQYLSLRRMVIMPITSAGEAR